MGQPDGVTCYAGQFEYLAALAKACPVILSSLRSEVYEPLETQWKSQNPGVDPIRYRETDTALIDWCVANGFRESWLRDAARQTVQTWATVKDGQFTRWTYLSGDVPATPFEFKAYWFPVPPVGGGAPVTAAKFRKQATADFTKKLRQFIKSTSLAWGSSRKALAQHALWTVHYHQLGRSPEFIRQHIAMTVTSRAIQQRVQEFATITGLQIRAGKAGPKPKQ